MDKARNFFDVKAHKMTAVFCSRPHGRFYLIEFNGFVKLDL